MSRTLKTMLKDTEPAERTTQEIPAVDWTAPAMRQRLKRRHLFERVFKSLGLIATSVAGIFLTYLLFNIAAQGVGGFQHSLIALDIPVEAQHSSNKPTDAAQKVNPRRLIAESLESLLDAKASRADRRAAMTLISVSARATVRSAVSAQRQTNNTEQGPIRIWVKASAAVDQYLKGNSARPASSPDSSPDSSINTSALGGSRRNRLSAQQIGWIEVLRREGRTKTSFNPDFLSSGDSQEAELAGIGGALAGTLLTLLVTLALAFPVGVLSAIYLEEFSPKNRLTRFIEVNINNLAAVPSIVFGLLGLSVFLGVFGMPRSAPLVGGLTLALMTLPTIIIASRAAIRAVPDGIRQAARALGASPQQMVFHHVMPLAMPGVLTGTIIGIARALGETAPLLMIGMVAFVVNVPGKVTDAATVLPVQVFLWSDNTDRAFVEKTAAAILILLVALIILNGIAVILRRRFAPKPLKRSPKQMFKRRR